MFSQTDIYIQHEFKLGTRAIQLNATVQNLFNQQTATSKFITQLRSGNGLTFDQAAFYAGDINFQSLIQAASAGVAPGAPTFQDPRFLLANDYQTPILARFGVKFIF